MQFILRLLINALVIFLIAHFLKGVEVETIQTAIIVAILLGLVNTFLKPVLLILTLPVTILTLGLFYFVLNALMVLLVDTLVPGFKVHGFFQALIFSILISLTGSLLDSITGKN